MIWCFGRQILGPQVLGGTSTFCIVCYGFFGEQGCNHVNQTEDSRLSYLFKLLGLGLSLLGLWRRGENSNQLACAGWEAFRSLRLRKAWRHLRDPCRTLDIFTKDGEYESLPSTKMLFSFLLNSLTWATADWRFWREGGHIWTFYQSEVEDLDWRIHQPQELSLHELTVLTDVLTGAFSALGNLMNCLLSSKWLGEGMYGGVALWLKESCRGWARPTVYTPFTAGEAT